MHVVMHFFMHVCCVNSIKYEYEYEYGIVCAMHTRCAVKMDSSYIVTSRQFYTTHVHVTVHRYGRLIILNCRPTVKVVNILIQTISGVTNQLGALGHIKTEGPLLVNRLTPLIQTTTVSHVLLQFRLIIGAV